MINSLIIENFQSHKYSKLEFSPYVNVIVGASDSGKTSIIRALNWLICNRPSGDEYRAWCGGDTKTYLTTGTSKIGRIKTNSKNLYILNKQKFKAFGKNVPQEIKDALNFSDTNIQFQLDSPFLLSDSPSKVAQYFNKIVNLDVIDRAISNIRKKRKYIDSKYSFIEGELGKNKEQLKEYDNLDEIEKSVEKLEQLEKETGEIDENTIILRDLLSNIQILEDSYKKYKSLQSLEDTLNGLFTLWDGYVTLVNDINGLRGVVSNYDGCIIAIDNQKIVDANDEVNKLLDKYSEWNNIVDYRREMIMCIESIKDLEGKIVGYNTKIDTLTQEFNDKMGGCCPLCEQEIRNG